MIFTSGYQLRQGFVAQENPGALDKDCFQLHLYLNAGQKDSAGDQEEYAKGTFLKNTTPEGSKN